MKAWLIVATVAAALPAVAAPASAQVLARSTEAVAGAPDLTGGQSAARNAPRRTRKASRARETPRPPAPPADLPPGYHKVDHQTGLPNPSIPSADPRR